MTIIEVNQLLNTPKSLIKDLPVQVPVPVPVSVAKVPMQPNCIGLIFGILALAVAGVFYFNYLEKKSTELQ
jgi:hypothetical protein